MEVFLFSATVVVFRFYFGFFFTSLTTVDETVTHTTTTTTTLVDVWNGKRARAKRGCQRINTRCGRGEHGRCVNGWGTSLRPVAILTSTIQRLPRRRRAPRENRQPPPTPPPTPPSRSACAIYVPRTATRHALTRQATVTVWRFIWITTFFSTKLLFHDILVPN